MLTSDSTELSYHRLLKRQIRKSLPCELAEDPRLHEFLSSVSQAYLEFQEDLGRVEHILEQSSNELFKTNRELSRIAEEKTKEAAFSNQRLEEVVSSISEVLVQLDKDGNLVYLNSAWESVTGYSVAESLGKNWMTFIPAEAGNGIAELLDSEIKTMEATVQISTADRTEKWLGITLSHHMSADATHVGYIGTFVDITQRVESEKKLKSYMRDLEKINAELDQFAYVVSHDLKAPLRAINNLSEWIEEDITDLIEGDTKDQFKLLRGRVHRMESLINGILSYSRAGRIKTTKERFLVKSIVDDLCETFGTKKSVSFNLEGDPELELVSEKITLMQILQNFMSNGIKYNDKQDVVITVGWQETDSFIQFFVADNGPGISPEFHDKIFVIFQTLQSRDEVESTGVGLAIVKKIMDEKGGIIRVESIMKEGTTFFFTWPKNEVKDTDAQP
ncbi:sensor histidine kinase [Dyadobacter psychrotolerans]|uniref:histidine kinase n=1 Tax=Dyadobacter psychrotolerans TaxID=2541721 RepID=A0A4R5DJA4_9BACT|nr:ATP-binding protein [Dyadobacter psychrotolerans]TDE12034.1 PAS domain S-box protein [Dyadobacter psychrotolerans]